MSGSTIAQYTRAGASISELSSLAQKAWVKIRENDLDRAEVEKLCGPSLLSQSRSPFEFETDKSGISGIEILIGVVIAPYVKGFVGELSTEAGKESARQIWRRIVLPRIREMNSDAVGRERRQEGSRSA